MISIGAYSNSLRADSSETCFLKASPNQGLFEQQGFVEDRSPFLVISIGAYNNSLRADSSETCFSKPPLTNAILSGRVLLKTEAPFW